MPEHSDEAFKLEDKQDAHQACNGFFRFLDVFVFHMDYLV